MEKCDANQRPSQRSCATQDLIEVQATVELLIEKTKGDMSALNYRFGKGPVIQRWTTGVQ